MKTKVTYVLIYFSILILLITLYGSYKSIKSPLNYLLKVPIKMDLKGYNDLVFENTSHYQNEGIGISQNWIQYLLGLSFPKLRVERLAKHIATSKKGLCSQRSFLLMKILKVNGITSRLISLEGHVVLEAWNKNKFEILDPDYGLYHKYSLKELEGMSCFYSDPTYVDLFNSKENNKVSYFDTPLSQDYYSLCVLLEFLKWWIPIMILILCLFKLKGDK